MYQTLHIILSFVDLACITAIIVMGRIRDRRHKRELAAKDAEIATLKEQNAKLSISTLKLADKIDVANTK